MLRTREGHDATPEYDTLASPLSISSTFSLIYCFLLLNFSLFRRQEVPQSPGNRLREIHLFLHGVLSTFFKISQLISKDRNIVGTFMVKLSSSPKSN